MKELLYSMVAGLVEDTTAITIIENAPDEEGTTVFELSVGTNDMGRIIGKQGKIAKSIRTIMRAAAARTGGRTNVVIKDVNAE